MINHYKNTAITLLGFLCLLSCSKETIVAPATSSAISELKEWTHQVDPLGRASSIIWEVAIPINLSDSVTAYSAPVKNTSGESGDPISWNSSPLNLEANAMVGTNPTVD